MLNIVNNIHGSTVTRVILTTSFYSEFVGCLWEMKWMLLALGFCVAADFYYARGETKVRYKLAEGAGDVVMMEHFKWRTSRATRRSVNKSIDYVIWMLLGMLIGKGLLDPIGVSHIWGMWAAAMTACACEIMSAGGHFFFLRGVNIEKRNINGFIKAFVVAIAKKKDEDIGESLEEAFNNEKEKEY